MAILVVVDMQPRYKAARNLSLQARVRQTIRAHKGPVCIVEFEHAGRTFPGILAACRGKRKFECVKNRDDGGDVVVGATRAEGLARHRHYIVCGVNTAYCVTGTATGILKNRRDAKVTLLVKACRNQNDYANREPTFAAAHVWAREDDYVPKHKRRRFLRFKPLDA